jgi:hypothetical protein
MPNAAPLRRGCFLPRAWVELLPVFWTALSWKIPALERGPGSQEKHLDQALEEIAPDRRASALVVILKSFSDPGASVRLYSRRTI